MSCQREQTSWPVNYDNACPRHLETWRLVYSARHTERLRLSPEARNLIPILATKQQRPGDVRLLTGASRR